MKSQTLNCIWTSLIVLGTSLLPAQAQTIQAESIVSETTPNPQLEGALRREYPNAGAAKYQYNRVDLNGDGEAEVLVLLSGRTLCGSGGCQIMVLQRSGQDYHMIANLFGLALPIVVSDQTTNGWHDLVSHGSSLFNREDYYRLRFNGNTYSSEQLPSNAIITGRGFLSGGYSNEGIPLR